MHILEMELLDNERFFQAMEVASVFPLGLSNRGNCESKSSICTPSLSKYAFIKQSGLSKVSLVPVQLRKCIIYPRLRR